MAITRIKNSSIRNGTPKYNDFQAGLPFRPIIGTATDGGNGTTVSVAFTGNNPAGAGVTYTALSSPGSITATGPTSPITVSGLTAGTAYTFQVKAGNSLGDSAYSAASNSVTPIQPTAYESIATATGSGATSVTFSSISGTYQHLQIRFMTAQSDNSSLRLRVNGSSSSSNYTEHLLEGTGTVAQASGNGSGVVSGIFLGSLLSDTNMFNVGIIDIHDYASTTKNKTVRIFSGKDRNGSGGVVYLASGLYLNTSAITSLTLYVSGANFTSNSSFALYGIKGS